MATLTWDVQSERYYETKKTKGVLYPFKERKNSKGVAWNGLTAVNENPSGAEPTPLYADNIKYLNLLSNEEFAATVEAYTYPDEFAECDGSAELAVGVSVGQQKRIPFGLSYVTKLGNDTDGQDHGYKIHLIYGALAKPTQKNYATINDNPEAITFSWELSTTPVAVPNMRPTACITIDSTKVEAGKLKKIEDKLYGTETEEATLPTPTELAALIAA